MESLLSSGLPRELIVLLIAALPLIELRGAIPVGILLLGMPPWEVFLLSMAGNLLPIPLILWVLPPLRRLASEWPGIGKVLKWAEERAMKRRGSIERYGYWGLVTFVGVPLPGTGAWTGSLIAVLLDMSPVKSLLATTLGVVLAGIVIALLSAMGLGVFY